MRDPIFRGIATALVTPMNEDKSVDYDSFGRLIDWQIEEGIDALVIAGTSGEGSTLSDEEHKDVVEYAVKRADGRVPIIAGTGSNDTNYAKQLTKACCERGADAMLVVTPYYNKATQKGLIRLYNEIAEASTKPIILYNVPSRTGVNIEPDTYVELAKNEKITAIKEANSNIGKIVEAAGKVKGKLDIYSGNDDQIVPIMSVGGIGCISVLSNVIPAGTREICTRFFNGDLEGAAELQFKYQDLISALFCEVNPIPVKAAVAAMGKCKNVLRSPLYPMEEKNRQRLLTAMKDLGVEVHA